MPRVSVAEEPSDPPEPEVRTTTNKAATEDPYLRLFVAHFGIATAFDFSERIEGAELSLAIVGRGTFGYLGAGLNFGVLANVLGSVDRKLILYAPLYLEAGLRLGSSLSEFVLRGGAAVAWVSKLEGQGTVFKGVGGVGFIVRFDRGSAIRLGFDLFVDDRLAHVITIGWRF